MWFDIIIFAAVAAFLAWRLHSVLGQRNDGETGRSNPFATDNTAPSRAPAPRDAEPTLPNPIAAPLPTGPAPDSLAGRLTQIASADPAFSEKSFLAGARSAFETIVRAFAANDTATLRPLLSDDVYDSFASAIRARQARHETLETRIMKIKSIDLIDASMTLNTARVSVRLTSEQIMCTRDAQGAVTSGDPSTPVEVTDQWTFVRNTRSLDPNWQLAETRAEG